MKNNNNSNKGIPFSLLALGTKYALDTNLLINIYPQIHSENDAKDLIIFLKNEQHIDTIKTIQYLVCLFNISLFEANTLYQDNIPNVSDIQTKFLLLNLDAQIERARLYNEIRNINVADTLNRQTNNFISKKQSMDKSRTIARELNLPQKLGTWI